MNHELAMRKLTGRTGAPGLVPADRATAEWLLSVPDGEFLRVKASRKRSLPHHRLFRAILSKVAESHPEYMTADALLFSIKVALGYCDLVHDIKTGEIFPRPKSTRFSEMDADSFRKFFDEAMDLMFLHLFPRMENPALEAEVLEMIGERRAA